MNKRITRPWRMGHRLVASTVLALIASMFHAPAAFAQTTCDRAMVDGYDRLAVSMTADQTVAVRFIAGTVDLSEDVNAGATDFVPQQAGLDADCVAEAGIDLLLVNGTDAGGETLKVIEEGTSGETPLSDVHTIVDLGDGNDMLEFMSADTNNNAAIDPTPGITLALGTSGGGMPTTVADQGVTEGGNSRAECVGAALFDVNGFGTDCSDLQVLDGNNLKVTGGTSGADFDIIDAQGDFDDGEVISAAGDPPNPVIPGTAGNDGLETVGGVDLNDNEPNGGNLDQPMTANLNAGMDAVAPGDGNDTLDGGGGADTGGGDTIDYSEAGAAVDVDLSAGTTNGGSGTDVIVGFDALGGSAFDDHLLGSENFELMIGSCGNDYFDGRALHDAMYGDSIFFFLGRNSLCDQLDGAPTFTSGGDTFYQGSADDGEDYINGGHGEGVQEIAAPDFLDTVDYGQRTTDIYLNPGSGYVSGEGGCPLAATCEGDNLNGLEYFTAGTGNDTFVGSPNDESFQAGAGNDNMSGGDGEDWFDFSDSAAAVSVDVPAGTSSGNGSDTFDGSVEGFLGSAGNDRLIGSGKDNILKAGAGNDLLRPGRGADVVDGGDGTDRLIFASGVGVKVDLANGIAAEIGPSSAGSLDRLRHIENLTGSLKGDFLAGDSNKNHIAGLAGSDIIKGKNGDDKLFGGSGRDRGYGGLGHDHCSSIEVAISC